MHVGDYGVWWIGEDDGTGEECVKDWRTERCRKFERRRGKAKSVESKVPYELII